MKVIVIIISYNFEPWIDRCLGSLRASKHPVSVLVIDNHSTDHTVDRIRSAYPEVCLIENKENLGFGAANNIGFRKAIQEKADYVFLLNQDAWIDEHAIDTLIRLSQNHPQCGILSPVHLNGEGTGLDHGFAVYSGLSTLEQLQTNADCVETSFINAAFWLIPVRVLREVGGFSPLFHHYGEDKDYVNRLKYHNYSISYAPNAYGFHDRGQRKSNRQGFFRAEEVYLLSEYANINYSFGKAFGYGVLAGVKKALKALLHGKINDSIIYNRICFRLIKKTCYIRKARKETSRQKANYI
jgi:GT2 family glycosyltransferase